MMFNFYVNQHLFYALASEDVRPLAAALGKPIVTLHDPDHTHALKEIDRENVQSLSLAWRAPLLKQGGLFAPISREGALVFNNLFLTTACATVFGMS